MALTGPSSREGARYDSTFDAIQKAFFTAQGNSRSRNDAGAWSDDKVLRKVRWASMGVPTAMLVPTWFSCALHLDPIADDADEYEMDDAGNFVPCMDPPRTISPSDGRCEALMAGLMRDHGSIVIKPTFGVRIEGVLVLSTDAVPPLAELAAGDGEPRRQMQWVAKHDADLANGANTSQARGPLPTSSPVLEAERGVESDAHQQPAGQHVWAFRPNKNEMRKETVLRFAGAPGSGSLGDAEWFDACVRTHHQLRGYSDAFMIEPVITHDVELSVLAVNGGRFQVMAGRSNTMERLLMLEKSGTLIAPSDFSPPSCRPHVLSQRLRGMHTAMVLRQRTRGDAAGRSLHEVIREIVSTIGIATNASAFRADFFVRWGEAGGPATLHLNEIEHSFNAGCMVGWFGLAATDAAMRAWALGGDESQRNHLEARLRARDGGGTSGGSVSDVGARDGGGAAKGDPPPNQQEDGGGEPAGDADGVSAPLSSLSLSRLPLDAIPYRAWLADWEAEEARSSASHTQVEVQAS